MKNLHEHLLKLYSTLSIIFLSLFLIAVIRILFDISEPSPSIIIRALAYLIIANQNVMLYNQKKMRHEIEK